MSKSKLFILLSICVIFIAGCGSDSDSLTDKTNKIISDGVEVDTSGMQVMHCTREGIADSGIEVKLAYDLYYNGEDLNILHSSEKVISASEESLNTYQDAYEKIQENYKGLRYYDAKVVRGDTTVTSDIVINYEKIDIDKLLELEGEEDNIIKEGKAKVDLWLTLAKKFGTTCS